MYLTGGQVGGLWNAGSPELSFFSPHSSSQPPEWGRPGYPSIGEDQGAFQVYLHIRLMMPLYTQISPWPLPIPSSTSMPKIRSL